MEVHDVAFGLVHDEVIVRFMVVPDLIGLSGKAVLATVWGRDSIGDLCGQGRADCPDEGKDIARLQYAVGSHAGQMDKQIDLFAFESEERPADVAPNVRTQGRVAAPS